MVQRILSTRRRVVIGALAVLAVPVVAIAWWLGSPLFLDRTVQEAFPYSGGAVVPPGMTQRQVEETMATLAEIDAPASEAMPGAMAAAAVVKAGRFMDADSFHRGSGSATVYRLGDGAHVLRLEDFRVTNGPDLRVILSPHPSPRSRGDVTDAGYVELGKLKGNVGDQNYSLPADVEPDAFASVVIYCKPFHVIFSVAEFADG